MEQKQRVTALPNSVAPSQLWEALGSKLIETPEGYLLPKQDVVGSNPITRSMKLSVDLPRLKGQS